jgi:hypothetical protein
MNLHFYLPAARLQCTSCKGSMTFTALPSSHDSEFDSSYPRKLPAGIEQIFTAVYRCEMCRETSPNRAMQPTHVYEVRPRKVHRGVTLISDALPFGAPCWNAFGPSEYLTIPPL